MRTRQGYPANSQLAHFLLEVGEGTHSPHGNISQKQVDYVQDLVSLIYHEFDEIYQKGGPCILLQ